METSKTPNFTKKTGHFFLTRKEKVADCFLGEPVVVLADFSGVPAGTRGHIVEIYRLGTHEGVMVEWEGQGDLPKWQKPLQDGFGEDELEYLAFGTDKHPVKAK